MRRFFKDFSVGCGTLVLLGTVFFVILPLVLIVFKIALWLAVPLITIFLIVVLIAFLGRLILNMKKYW